MLHRALPIDLLSWFFIFVGIKCDLKFNFLKSLFLGSGSFLKKTYLENIK